MPDENTELLREIRDLLAGQEARYEQHRAETKKIYDEASRGAVRRQIITMIVGALLFGLAVGFAAPLARFLSE